MKLTDPELLELNELCQRLIDGVATRGEQAALQARLASSEEARRFYVRTMDLSASLFGYAGEMQSETPDLPRHSLGHETLAPALRWTIGGLAAAACLAVLLWHGGAGSPHATSDAPPAPDNEETVASLSGGKDCRWTGAALSSGQELRRGERLELASGVAEVTFDSGAEVVLEGPALLEVSSAWEAVLRRGTLKAVVPAEAVGFRVSHPQVEVVDLGTEFSMVAEETGAAEVFVLKGAVEAKAVEAADVPGAPVVLHEAQARRFARNGSSEVRDHDGKLARLRHKVALERFRPAAHYLHWSFDEASGRVAHVEVVGGAAGDFDARIEGDSGALAGAHVAGRWQRALGLSEQVAARSSLEDWAHAGPRTLAFWVKVPADSSFSESGALLTLPGSTTPAHALSLGWNRQPAQGPVGALRLDSGHAFAVASTPLRDDQWHHVAVVLKANPRHMAKLQVREYIDGRLEMLSGHRGGGRRDGAAPTPEAALWLGRSPERPGEHFRGTLDELFLADRILAPAEVKHLMENNTPLAAPEIAVR